MLPNDAFVKIILLFNLQLSHLKNNIVVFIPRTEQVSGKQSKCLMFFKLSIPIILYFIT